MGQAVRIADLARQMIRLSSFEPEENIEIVFTGLSPGEKLHEELISDGEEVVPTHYDRIRVLRLPPLGLRARRGHRDDLHRPRTR